MKSSARPIRLTIAAVVFWLGTVVSIWKVIAGERETLDVIGLICYALAAIVLSIEAVFARRSRSQDDL